MNLPRKVLTVKTEGGSTALVFPCAVHGSHVCIGFSVPGVLSVALHLEVAEAEALADALRLGPGWAGLELKPTLEGHPETAGDRQGAGLCRDGGWVVTLRGDLFILSLAPRNLSPVAALLNDRAREQLAAHVLELVHGKAAAA